MHEVPNNREIITHTVAFRLIHAHGSEEEARFLSDAKRLLAAIPGVMHFTVYDQVSEKSDLRFGFAMQFATAEAYRAYNEHPAHVGFVRERWDVEVAAFQELDYVERFV